MIRLALPLLLCAACSGDGERSEPPRAGKRDGFIGITYLWTQAGAEVDTIYPETPAERAGLRPGDIIAKFNWLRPESADDLQRFVVAAPIGSSATVEVVRDGQPMALHVRVSTWPAQLHRERAQLHRERAGY